MTGVELRRTRTFDTGPTGFVVLAPSPQMVATVEAIFSDLPSADGQEVVEVTLAEASDGSWSVAVGDQPRSGHMQHSAALANLVTAVTRLALDAEPDVLHLHAAALAHNDAGVVISAASGVGKSTLTTWLVNQGWAYLSDEAINLRNGQRDGEGFNKPILLKQGADEMFPDLDGASTGVDTESWMCLPVGSLQKGPLVQAIEPQLAVVLARRPDGDVDSPSQATPLHPTDAVVAFLGQTMDPERYGPDTLATLVQLATQACCVTLWVGPLPSMQTALEGALAQESEPPLVAELEADGERVPAAVRSFLIGERVVAHQTESGAVVALDEAGSAVWLALHDQAPAWFPPENLQAPETAAFLTQLRELELVDYT